MTPRANSMSGAFGAGIAIFVMAMASGHAAPAQEAQEVTVSVRQLDRRAMAGGSVVLELKVTYKGKKPTKIISLDMMEKLQFLTFDAPKEWTKKERGDPPPRLGWMPVQTLRRGDVVSRRICLQDYFEKMTSGKHSSRLTLRLWLATEDGTVPGSGTVSVSLREFDQESFSAYIKSLLAFVRDEEKPLMERTERCKELLSLRNPDIPAAFRAVLETKMLALVHDEVRLAFAEYTLESTSAREEALEYIREANKADRSFFLEFWKENKVELSPAEMETILGSHVRKHSKRLQGT